LFKRGISDYDPGDSVNGDVTRLLGEVAAGTPGASDRLLTLVYDELRQLAHHHRSRQGAAGVGTHSLVHEAFLRMADRDAGDWNSRGQFFYLASIAMRSVLIDNARYINRLKREGRWQRVELTEGSLVSAQRSEELLALDDALTRLKTADDRLGSIVECRFFGGLSIEETAEALKLSPATVKRGWTTARAWLFHELRGPGDLLESVPE
jgi:RNA polymerase sigma factor (TIGR02999 family)